MARTRNIIDVVIQGKNKLSGPLNKASGSLKALGKAGKIASVGIAATSAAAVAASVAFFKMAESTAVAGDQAAKAARRLRLTTEELSALEFAAQRSGASQASMRNTLRFLAKAAVEARDGVATYKDVFDELGISVLNRSGELKDLRGLFLETADAIGGIDNATRRLGLAQKILGRNAVELAVLFDEQKGGIEKLEKEARRLGGTISERLGRASEIFVDQMLDLKFALQGIRNAIIEAVLPHLTTFLKTLTEIAVTNRDKIVKGVIFIGLVFVEFAKTIKEMADKGIPRIKKAFEELAPGVKKLGEFAMGAAEGFIFWLENLGKMDRHPATIKAEIQGLEREIERLQSIETRDNPIEALLSGVPTTEKVKQEIFDTRQQLEKVRAELERVSPAADDAGEKVKTFSGRMAELRKEAERIAEAVATTPPQVSEQGTEVFAAGLQQQLIASAQNLDKLKEKFGEFADPVSEFQGALLQAEQAMRALGMATDETQVQFSELTDAVISQTTDRLLGAFNQMGAGIASTFAEVLVDQKNFGKQMVQVMKQFVKSMIAQIVKLIAKLIALAILQAVTGTSAVSAGKVSSIKKLLAIPEFIGGKARGGAIERGQFAVIGEKGPELFAPAVAGRIIPNHRAGETLDAMRSQSAMDGGSTSRILAALRNMRGAGIQSRTSLATVNLTVNVSSVFGARGERRAIAEEVGAAMIESGLLSDFAAG